MAAYDRSVQVWRNDAKPSNLRIDLGYQELPSTTYLLLLGLYVQARDDIAQNNALSVQLHPATLVGFKIVDLEELLTVLNRGA